MKNTHLKPKTGQVSSKMNISGDRVLPRWKSLSRQAWARPYQLIGPGTNETRQTQSTIRGRPSCSLFPEHIETEESVRHRPTRRVHQHRPQHKENIGNSTIT